MKWIVYSVTLGIAEVLVISELHGRLGTYNLMIFYIATTAIGAIFLLLQLPKFRAAMKALKTIDKQWKKRASAPDFKLTADDMIKVKPMIYVGMYFPALVLIAIPGIVSDVIGIILVFPVISNKLLEYRMNRAIEHVSSQNGN